MPKRSTIFANGQYYHIYNRSAFGAEVFNLTSTKVLRRVLGIINFYKYPQKIGYSRYKTMNNNDKIDFEVKYQKQTPLVDILTFAIMPNHFHFLLKQNSESGVRRFTANFQNSYAKYYNIKHERKGSIFQGPFKAKLVDNEDQLLHLSRYIHLNPVTSYLLEPSELKTYHWTSFPYYCLNNLEDSIVSNELIIKLAGSKAKYSKFVFDQVDYQRELKRIKDLIL